MTSYKAALTKIYNNHSAVMDKIQEHADFSLEKSGEDFTHFFIAYKILSHQIESNLIELSPVVTS